MKENIYVGDMMSSKNSEKEPEIKSNSKLVDDTPIGKIATHNKSNDVENDQQSMWWLNVRRRCHKLSNTKRSHIRRKH